MATQWILGKVSDALSPTVSSVCASGGGFAGGAIDTVGSGINGIGESIGNRFRGYGDGAKDYGNAIRDWSGFTGSRAQTASNPLGLSDTRGGGKAKTTSPSIYRAPVREKKVAAAPVQKKVVNRSGTTSTSGAQPKPRVKPKVEPTKKVAPLKAGSSSARATTQSGTGSVTKSVAAASRPKAPIKPVVTTATTAGRGASVKKATAANPLGLTR